MTTSLFVCFFLLPLHIQLPWLLYLLLLGKTDNFIRGFGFMVFNATFNIISVILWQSALLVVETGVPG